MQQIATVSSNGAAVNYDNGVFTVGGEAVGIDKVTEYDKLGVLTWVSEETKTWAYQTAAAAPAGPQPVAAQSTGKADKSKKAWYKKWWVWAIAAVLIIGAISSCSGGGSKTTTASAPSSPAASTPAEKPAEPAATPAPAAAPAPAADQTTKLGTPLKVGDLVFTANDAKATKKLKSVIGNKSGNWVVVTATVKNESKEAVTIDSSFFKLLGADGATYETDSDSLMYIDSDKNFFLAKINPNLSKKGTVLFAVPEGANPADFKLQVQTGAFGTQTGEIALTK